MCDRYIIDIFVKYWIILPIWASNNTYLNETI